MPDKPAMTLAQYCPDLQTWPQRWMYDEPDIAPGEQIVEFFTPFLMHLLHASLTLKTRRRHRDNLWLLGGELIKRRYQDAALRKLPPGKAILELIDDQGGPLMVPSITEEEQDSVDATCRKLYKFLNAPKPVA